jgi:hypothetical protein
MGFEDSGEKSIYIDWPSRSNTVVEFVLCFSTFGEVK